MSITVRHPEAPAADAPAEQTAAYQAELRVWGVAQRIGGRSLFEGEVSYEAPAKSDLAIAQVAVTLADEHAPAAPEHVRTEAAIRCAGWIRDMEPAIASRTVSDEGASDALAYRASNAGALRASGGMGLLARYVSRRAV